MMWFGLTSQMPSSPFAGTSWPEVSGIHASAIAQQFHVLCSLVTGIFASLWLFDEEYFTSTKSDPTASTCQDCLEESSSQVGN